MTQQLLQLKRSYSHPLQKSTHNKVNNNPLPIKPSRSTNTKTVQPVYPLTEANLALHTKSFPPSKDARCANTRKFVDNQRPVIEMELLLEIQREQELSQLGHTRFSDPFDNQLPLSSSRPPRKMKWFSKFVDWVRFDNQEGKKKRHLSWSAGTEKENHKVVDCHNRDSGISLRRTSLLSAIPIVRQPKFTSNQKLQHLNEFKAFPYPKTTQHNYKDTSPSSPTMIDEPSELRQRNTT